MKQKRVRQDTLIMVLGDGDFFKLHLLWQNQMYDDNSDSLRCHVVVLKTNMFEGNAGSRRAGFNIFSCWWSYLLSIFYKH